jgi:hypothetical protein
LAPPEVFDVPYPSPPPYPCLRRCPARQPAESASAFIDQKIKELGDWRGKTLAKVREIVHEADPEIVEEWKWVKPTNPGTPVWSHGGIVCTGETYKNVVKMTFAKGAALEDLQVYSTPASRGMSGAPSTSTKATRWMRRP